MTLSPNRTVAYEKTPLLSGSKRSEPRLQCLQRILERLKQACLACTSVESNPKVEFAAYLTATLLLLGFNLDHVKEELNSSLGTQFTTAQLQGIFLPLRLLDVGFSRAGTMDQPEGVDLNIEVEKVLMESDKIIFLPLSCKEQLGKKVKKAAQKGRVFFVDQDGNILNSQKQAVLLQLDHDGSLELVSYQGSQRKVTSLGGDKSVVITFNNGKIRQDRGFGITSSDDVVLPADDQGISLKSMTLVVSRQVFWTDEGFFDENGARCEIKNSPDSNQKVLITKNNTPMHTKKSEIKIIDVHTPRADDGQILEQLAGIKIQRGVIPLSSLAAKKAAYKNTGRCEVIMSWIYKLIKLCDVSTAMFNYVLSAFIIFNQHNWTNTIFSADNDFMRGDVKWQHPLTLLLAIWLSSKVVMTYYRYKVKVDATKAAQLLAHAIANGLSGVFKDCRSFSLHLLTFFVTLIRSAIVFLQANFTSYHTLELLARLFPWIGSEADATHPSATWIGALPFISGTAAFISSMLCLYPTLFEKISGLFSRSSGSSNATHGCTWGLGLVVPIIDIFLQQALGIFFWHNFLYGLEAHKDFDFGWKSWQLWTGILIAAIGLVPRLAFNAGKAADKFYEFWWGKNGEQGWAPWLGETWNSFKSYFPSCSSPKAPTQTWGEWFASWRCWGGSAAATGGQSKQTWGEWAKSWCCWSNGAADPASSAPGLLINGSLNGREATSPASGSSFSCAGLWATAKSCLPTWRGGPVPTPTV